MPISCEHVQNIEAKRNAQKVTKEPPALRFPPQRRSECFWKSLIDRTMVWKQQYSWSRRSVSALIVKTWSGAAGSDECQIETNCSARDALRKFSGL